MAASDVFDIFSVESGRAVYPLAVERVIYQGADITKFLARKEGTFDSARLHLAYQLELGVRSPVPPEAAELLRQLQRIAEESPSIIVVRRQGASPGEQWLLQLDDL